MGSTNHWLSYGDGHYWPSWRICTIQKNVGLKQANLFTNLLEEGWAGLVIVSFITPLLGFIRTFLSFLQEARMSRAAELMVQHVENLKRHHLREHAELEDMKRLIQQNSRNWQLTENKGKIGSRGSLRHPGPHEASNLFLGALGFPLFWSMKRFNTKPAIFHY